MLPPGFSLGCLGVAVVGDHLFSIASQSKVVWPAVQVRLPFLQSFGWNVKPVVDFVML